MTGQGGHRLVPAGNSFEDIFGGVGGVLPGGYRDVLRSIAGADYPVWSVQLRMTYPLGRSADRAAHERARRELQQNEAQIRRIELRIAGEVTAAALRIESIQERIEAATASRELAEEQLQAEESKFETGLSTNFFVLQSQRDLAAALPSGAPASPWSAVRRRPPPKPPNPVRHREPPCPQDVEHLPMSRTDLMRGTLDLLLLRALMTGPYHGLGVARGVEQLTQEAFRINPGSLFPALHRLEQKGWLTSEWWGRSETNRKAKFYELTAAGRRHAEKEARNWKRVIVVHDEPVQGVAGDGEP